jgi:radical SAM superfamily enzyme
VKEKLEGPLTNGCRVGDLLEVTNLAGFNLDDEGSPITTYFHGGDQTDLPLGTSGELVSIAPDQFQVRVLLGEEQRIFSLHPTEIRNTGENTYRRYMQQFGQDPVALSKAVHDEAETAIKARYLANAREKINLDFDQKTETILTSLVNTFNLNPEQLTQIRAGQAFEYQIPVVEETTARLPFRELAVLMLKMMEYHQEVKVDLPKELKHLDGKPLTEAQFKNLVLKSAAKIKKPLEELVQNTSRSTADLLSKQHYLKGREFRIRDERKDTLNGVFEYLLGSEGEAPTWLRRLMLYNDRPIFQGGDPFAPPSEELVRVVKLETGGGCNYAKCTFCTEYAKAEFFFRDPKSFQEHAQEVRRKLGADLAYIQRVFLSGGDTFSLPTETLLAYLKTVERLFNHQRVKSPDHGEVVRTAIRRVEAFTRTEGILTKSEEELDQLRQNNLTLLYWGAETGSDAVLQYVNKGITRAEMDKAVNKIKDSGINVSVMIMPGLGGIAHYDDHVIRTREVLNRLHPRYTTFHTVTPKPHTVYARKMAGEMQQGTNRPLTDEEVVEQMHDIVSGMRDGYTSLVATYYPPSAKIAINPVSFRGYLHRGGKEGILDTLRNYFTEEGHTPSAALEQRDFNKNSRIRRLVQ